MKSKDWLKKFPVIRFNEIARRLNSKEYAKVFINRLVKSNYISKVTKGVYSTSDNLFEVASNIHHPSYISFLSASYRYGFTETIPRIIYVVSNKRHKSIEFKGYSIEFVKSNHILGYHKEGNEFIADVEKLITEAFTHPKHIGNFEEIKNILVNSEKINPDIIRQYLKQLKSNKIYRQVGYMLENYKKVDISGLLPIDRNYHDLNPFKKCKTINKKWRLRI